MSALSKREVKRLVDDLERQGARIRSIGSSGYHVYLPDGNIATFHLSESTNNAWLAKRNTIEKAGLTWRGPVSTDRSKKMSATITQQNAIQAAVEHLGPPRFLNAGEVARITQVRGELVRDWLTRNGWRMHGRGRGAVWTRGDTTYDEKPVLRIVSNEPEENLPETAPAAPPAPEPAPDVPEPQEVPDEAGDAPQAAQEDDVTLQAVPADDAAVQADRYALGEVAGYEQACNELNPKIEELTAQLEQANQAHEELQAEHLKLGDRLRTVHAQRNGIQEQLEAAALNYDDLQEKCNAIQAERDNLWAASVERPPRDDSWTITPQSGWTWASIVSSATYMGLKIEARVSRDTPTE